MVSTLYGSNIYLINKFVKEKVRNVNKINITTLEVPTAIELAEAVNISPILSTKRVVIVQSLKKLNEYETIAIIENKLSTTYLIFQLNDKAFHLKVKLKNFLQQNSGSCEVYNEFKPKDAERYLKAQVMEKKLNFSPGMQHYFLFRVGLNTAAIDIELGYLAQLKTKAVTRDGINNLIARRTSLDVFKVINSIFKKSYKESIDLIQQYIAEHKSNINKMLVLLIQDLHIMIMIKDSRRIHELNFNHYRIVKLTGISKHIAIDRLIELYVDISTLQLEIRSGINPEIKLYAALNKFKRT